MTQRTGGLWKIFSSPAMYQWVQNLLGRRTRELFVEQYIRARPGDFLLDVGCGTGEIVEYLHDDIQYVGIDFSQEYINFALRRNHKQAHFICGDVADVDYSRYGRPDIILAEGLLHHLGDEEVCALLQKIKKVINISGRMVSIDPCFTAKQNIMARTIMRLDRGKNVRSLDSYHSLANRYFDTIKSEIRADLLSLPYSHCIMECSNEQDGNSIAA
jgi:SAM-dependent methyltransferase